MINGGEVYLFNTADGGDINVVNGITETRAGLETAAYLSMFGGNAEDDASENKTKQFWGNLLETQPSKQYRSKTQYILSGLPATASNLLKLERAVNEDLKWMLETGVSSKIEVKASIPSLNRVEILVTITAKGAPSSFNFYLNWIYSV